MAREGETATGPNGQRAIYRGGQWIAMPSGVVSLPAKPAAAYEVPKVQADIDSTGAGTTRTRVQTVGDQYDNQVKSATRDALIRKVQAEADKAAADATVAQRAANAPRSLNDDQLKAAGQQATLDAIIPRLNKAQELYDRDVAPENLLNNFGILDFFATPTTKRFDTVGEQIADLGLNAFRTPGVGSQSDLEAKSFAAANKPNTSDFDSATEEKLIAMRSRVDANRSAKGLPPAQWRPQGFDANDPNQALAVGFQTLTREMQGKSPAQRQAMLQAFNADPRIASIKSRAGFRDPGGRASTAGAPRKPQSDPELDAAMAKHLRGR